MRLIVTKLFQNFFLLLIIGMYSGIPGLRNSIFVYSVILIQWQFYTCCGMEVCGRDIFDCTRSFDKPFSTYLCKTVLCYTDALRMHF
jgi:hypothetical protein